MIMRGLLLTLAFQFSFKKKCRHTHSPRWRHKWGSLSMRLVLIWVNKLTKIPRMHFQVANIWRDENFIFMLTFNLWFTSFAVISAYAWVQLCKLLILILFQFFLLTQSSLGGIKMRSFNNESSLNYFFIRWGWRMLMHGKINLVYWKTI